MDREKLKAHPLWDVLSASEESLQEAEQWLSDAAAPSSPQVRWCLATLRSHDDPSDAAPYSVQTLDQIQTALTQVQNGLDQVVAQENGAYLANVDAYTDQLTMHINALPSQSNRDPARTAGRTFVDYREAVEGAMASLRQQSEQAQAEIERLQDEQKAQQTAHESAVVSLQQEIAGLSKQIADDAERSRKQLTEASEAFNAKQTERQERFTQWLEEKGEEIDAKAASDLSEVTNMRRRAKDRLNEIEILHDDVEKVSSKAAAAILAKDYGSYSTREWFSGVVAYALGFLLLVALAGYLLVTVADVSRNDEVSWQYVALKLGLTLSAVAASGVAFQFGSHALSRASTNKRVQLELGTIGTFLADVGDEEAVQSAKVDFVNRMFGRAWERSSHNDSETVNVSAVSKLLDVLNRSQGGSS